jgi:Fe-S cluster assembly iron-binding protein IscA
MALDESIANLDKLENNGVTAYIAPDLKKALEQFDSISIDYVTRPDGGGGYTIRAGKPGECGSGESGGCSGCG